MSEKPGGKSLDQSMEMKERNLFAHSDDDVRVAARDVSLGKINAPADVDSEKAVEVLHRGYHRQPSEGKLQSSGGNGDHGHIFIFRSPFDLGSCLPKLL